MSSSPSFPDRPVQLPLPSTLTSSARHTRQGSTGTTTTARGEPSRSPTLPSFSSQYQHNSSTHAGGIQPSASFFRPSRPSQQYRPPSVDSEAEGNALPTDGDVYNLSSLTKQISNSSDENPPPSLGEGTAEDEFTKQRPKPSREPLLPLATRPAVARPTLLRDRSGSASPGGPLSPSRMMRNSLERVFSLRRGMSFESLRRPAGAGGGARDSRPTFEGGKLDEEHGMYDIPQSPYKTSTAPGDYPSAAGHSPTASVAPSFIAEPAPTPGPPRSAMPVLDPITHKPLRNYELHPSRNRFFLRGHILTGGDSPWAFICSFSLLLTIAGVWFGTTCVYWWHHVSPAVAIVGAYLALITISTMIATATRDPGILPRNLDPDPPYPATSPSDGGLRAPMPRDLKVRSDVVRVKYCPTCQTYRPPRSSHCKMCDNCVDGCDHHCQWVNNCVGRRNYTTFFVLLFCATATAVLVIVTSAIHLYLLARHGNGFKHALRHGAGSAVVFCLAIAVIWPVAALLTYHMRLLLLNITTIEQIRNQAHKTLIPGPAPPNPFSHGSWRKNLFAVLCRPVGSSWLDASAFATQDERDVNPGLGGGAAARAAGGRFGKEGGS